MRISTTFLRLFVLALLPFGAAHTARADALLNVSFDTTPLIGHPSGPFYFFAAFIDGSGVGDGNNTVTVDQLDLGGGSLLADSALAIGGAAGDLAGGVRMTDSEFASLFFEGFVPGARLGLRLGLTTRSDDDGVPDVLTLSILDGAGIPVPTSAPVGDFFLRFTLAGGDPLIEVFGGDPSRSLSYGGFAPIEPPTVGAVTVPEPSELMMLGLAALAAWRRRGASVLRRRAGA